MKHDFDQLVDRRNTECKKYSEEYFPADVIPMWIADTDFKAPQLVVDALVKRMMDGVYGYPVVSSRLRKAVQRWENVRFKWDISEESVEFIPGVIGGIICAVRTLSNPGDKIVIQTPCYPPFTNLADYNGRHLLRNKMILKDGKYTIDFEDLENKLKDSRSKILILCNPQNPTGRVFTKEELIKIGDLCLKHHVTVLADEIHCDIVYAKYQHIPFGSLSKDFSMNSITFVNPSKTFNLPGFRTAAMICENPVIKSAVHNIVMSNKAIGENICGTLALCTAYESCDYYADQVVEYLQKNREYAVERINQMPNIEITDAEGTYFLWLDCTALKMTQDELASFFCNQAKLGLNDGVSFGQEGIGFMRMNIGCPKKTLVKAMDRLEIALTHINKGGSLC